jgi:hypothetical protein
MLIQKEYNSMDIVALDKAALLLRTTAEELSYLPEDVQQDMAAAVEPPVSQAFSEVQRIWNRAFLREEMQAVSRVSGVFVQSLISLPQKVQITLSYLLSENPADAVTLNRCITAYLGTAALPDIAALLKTPLHKLTALPIEQQKAICGAFDVLCGTVSDEALAAELNAILQRMEES